MSEEMMNNSGSDEVSGKNTDEQEKESTMTNTPKTRGPYDGSYAHGVTADIEHINTILGYKKALARLKTRRNFLVKEYQKISDEYKNTDSITRRAELLKEKSSKEAQIKTVEKTRSDLLKLEDEINVAEREAQEAVSFESYEIEG